MNKVFLIGNLTDNPKTITTTSGITMCSFRLAVQRRFTNSQTGGRETDFFPIVAWRKTGDLCATYLAKGRKCAVAGSLQTRSYDAQDGTKRYVTEIIADEVEFLGSRNDQQNTAKEQSPQPQEYTTPEGFTQVEDEDLPF